MNIIFDVSLFEDYVNKSINKLQKLKITDVYFKISLKKNNRVDVKNEDIIESFRIIKSNEAIFYNITSGDDFEKMIDTIGKDCESMVNAIEKYLDRNKQYFQTDTINAINMISTQILRFQDNIVKKLKKMLKKVQYDDVIDCETKNEIFNIMVKSFDGFITETISTVRRGMKINEEPYKEIVNLINAFFRSVGIYTYDVKLYEKIEDDFCSFAHDDGDEITHSFNDNDKVIKIKQYPYLFADGTLISRGYVNVWRFEE